jgi:hypothetical protein
LHYTSTFFKFEFEQVANLQTREIMQGFYWAPVVEAKNPDAFLTKNMYGLLQAGNVVAVPIIIGITSEEGIAWNQGERNCKKKELLVECKIIHRFQRCSGRHDILRREPRLVSTKRYATDRS